MSAGAILTHRIGRELSSCFAAIAPVEGTIAITPCLPSTPISIFKIHGNADRNIPFYGGFGCGGNQENFSSVTAIVQTWIDLQGCNCSFEGNCGQVVLTDSDGVCTKYGTCDFDVYVTMCVVIGAGHAWPGVPGQQVQPQCNGTIGNFSTTEHI